MVRYAPNYDICRRLLNKQASRQAGKHEDKSFVQATEEAKRRAVKLMESHETEGDINIKNQTEARR